MKNSSKNLFLFTLFYIFGFLVFLSNEEENKYIKEKITIKDKKPFITINIGDQDKMDFLLSFSSPILITFPKKNNTDFRYDKSKGPFKSNNISSKIKYLENEYEFNIGTDNIVLNGKKNVFNFGNIKNDNFPDNDKFAGLFGLNWGKMDIQNLKDNNIFLNQLIEKQLISKKIFYIEPYFKGNKILSESNIIIGKFPDKFDKKLPFCILKENSKYYDCPISDVSLEIKDNNNNLNKTTYFYGKSGLIEEEINEQNYLPQSLFDNFKKYFKEKGCTEENSEIKCQNKDKIKNLKISLKISNYILNLNSESIWNEEKLNFKLSKEDKIILTNSIIGNFYRIYDIEEKKLYLKEVIIDNPKKDNSSTMILILTVGLIIFILIVVIVIITFVVAKKKSNLSQKVNKVSFQDEENNENEEDQDGLLY